MYFSVCGSDQHSKNFLTTLKFEKFKNNSIKSIPNKDITLALSVDTTYV